MKNIIAITACLKRCSIAISYKNQIFQTNEATDAAANLAFLLHETIKKNCIEIKEIEGIITASGPGSFTGIRTAQSLAKAVAMTLKIPATCVSYFDVIDHIAAEGKNRLIIIKSEKEQAYFKKIQGEQNEIGVSSYEGILKKIDDDCILIGENISEIHQLIKDSRILYREVADFREAKHLLDFSEKATIDSKISPLYINAMQQAPHSPTKCNITYRMNGQLL